MIEKNTNPDLIDDFFIHQMDVKITNNQQKNTQNKNQKNKTLEDYNTLKLNHRKKIFDIMNSD